MRIETNERLVNRNKKFAQYLFFGSLGLLVLSLFLTNAQTVTSAEEASTALLLPAIILPIAFIATLISVRMTNLWIRPPRPETQIQEGIKGAAHNTVLYNYYHFPARHVIIAPQGVFAIVTRFQDGLYEVDGEKWTTKKNIISRILSIFRFDHVGNPTNDARKAAAHLQTLVDQIDPEVKVQPLIIFTDPRASVTVNNSPIPVVHANPKQTPALKDFLKKAGHQKTLTKDQIQAFEDLTLK